MFFLSLFVTKDVKDERSFKQIYTQLYELTGSNIGCYMTVINK